MAWVNKFDFGLLNAFAIREAHPGHETAVLMSRRGAQDHAPVLEAVGRHPAALPGWSTHTAIVNAIQGRAAGQGNLGNLVVFATYQPTQACIGMMKTHGLHSVTSYHNHAKSFIDVAGVANVNAMASAALPPTANPNRINTPGGQDPPAGLLADPSANVHGQTARTYLTTLAGQAFASYAGWRNSWNANPVPVVARQHAGVQQYLTLGGGFSQPIVDTIFTLFTYAVAGRVQWPGDEAGSRIVGVLANQHGQIFGWQVNHRHINTTYHAETNLVQALGQIPAGATLYSTLEPCHQCAGLFVRAGGNRCVFGQNDPNMVGNTALAGQSARLLRPTFSDYPQNAPLTVGARLDQIRNFSSVATQAAAVARTLQQRNAGVADALAHTNYLAIQNRVLNILNMPPSRELFAQSDRFLRAWVGIIRGQHPLGTPRRIFAENIAQALNY